MPDAATRHVCSYPVQPRDEDGNPQDRARCLVPGCEVRRGRTVPVDEALLRSALRDALAFAQALENSGDEDATEFVREYETALLQLADAPEVTPAEEVAMLRRGGETLGRIVVRMARSMEAARIDYLQNGPKAGMQWILNSLPDVDDNDPEDQWNGTETAAQWLDRTDERAKETVSR